ncbi:MAG: lipopolysaccharide biosynthesis protein [Haloechinothrix sp.]
MSDHTEGGFADHAAVHATASTRGFLRVLRWSFAMESGRQTLSLAVAFILAAVLGPEAYGLVAMAMTYVLFVELVQQQGLSAAIVQRKELTRRHADTAFWMIVGSSGLLTLVSVGLSGWWAGLNRLPELQPVIMALSALVPVHALVIVQEALLRRRMAYRALAIRTFVAVSAGAAAGLSGAFLGWGVWALVAQQLTAAVVSVVVLWSVSGWRPRFGFSRACARELFGFSSGSFLSHFAVFVNRQADVLLIGFFFGPVVVGLYRFGMRLVEFLLQATSRPFQSIALAELAPFQNDLPAFRRRLLRLLGLSASLTVPAMGVLAGVAGPAVALLGAEWSSAVWPLRVLCVVGVVWALSLLDIAVLQALRRPHLGATVSWLAAGLSAGSLVVAALAVQGRPIGEQVLGVATARAVVYGAAILLLHLIVLARYAGVGPATLVRAHAGTLASALTGALVGVLVDGQVAGLGALTLPRLFAAGGSSVIAAGLVLLAVDTQARAAVRLVWRRAGAIRGGGSPQGRTEGSGLPSERMVVGSGEELASRGGGRHAG